MSQQPVILNREESRLVDKIAIDEYGIPGIVLMENAGRGVAEIMREVGIFGPISIWCGSGNNGGDGFVIARHLHNWGHEVCVALVAESSRLKGDALINWRIVNQMSLPNLNCSERIDPEAINFMNKSDWVVDCLLGTGANGEPRPHFAHAINKMNESSAKRLSVDIPSGLDCDSGRPAKSTIRADYTCVLASQKPMLLALQAKPFLGSVRVVDIGVPKQIIERIVENRNKSV